HFSFSASALNNGMYLLVINTETGSFTKKIIVQHGY
ncbi:MAG: T9SS type A sorting domain-containing protein, partial [Bacteroidetes bacterium]|nr:T9SS type A sorting domain-containing protein [Bacteroidota bacterium]